MKILDIPQSGKRGLTVSIRSPFGLCSRTHFYPKRTVTPARERMWGVFRSNSQMWSRTLSEDQRHRWCATGAKVMSYPRLGQKGPLSGQQFWQSISSVRGCVGLPADLEPPAPVVFDPAPRALDHRERRGRRATLCGRLRRTGDRHHGIRPGAVLRRPLQAPERRVPGLATTPNRRQERDHLSTRPAMASRVPARRSSS